MSTLQLYRIGLTVSLIVNVLLVAAIWFYVHFAGLLDIVATAVGFLN